MSNLSVRARLTLWNMAALALTLLVSAIVIHQVVGALLTRSIDRDLARQAASPLPAAPVVIHRVVRVGAGGPELPDPLGDLPRPRNGGPDLPDPLRDLPRPRTGRFRSVFQAPLKEGSDVVFSHSHTFLMLRLLKGRTARPEVSAASDLWSKLVQRASRG
ncbi:MAG: hypothetical protein LC772_11605, partial [Chloroflexi bacterium]|nr:hypothetical protein [Chloroflexota bacterium]